MPTGGFTGDPDRARIAGAKGNESQRRNQEYPRKITGSVAHDNLPTLTCAVDVQSRIETLTRWGACGLLSPGTLSALVRLTDLWLKAQDLKAVEDQLAELRKHVDELESELKRRPRVVA